MVVMSKLQLVTLPLWMPMALVCLVQTNAGCDSGSDAGSPGLEPARNRAEPAGVPGSASRTESGDASGPGSMAPSTGGPAFGNPGAGSAGSGASGSADGDDGAGAPVEPGGAGEADAGAPDPIEIEPGQLTAGEWSDLANWSFWSDLHDSEGQCEDVSECQGDSDVGVAAQWREHWGFDTLGRVAVRVQSGSDPVIDAAVELRNADDEVVWSARTDSQGRAELFAGAFQASSGDHSLRVTAGDETVDVAAIEPGSSEPVEVAFPIAHAPPPSLDLMFMIDTTGSMGDELTYIQAELGHVIEQVRDEIGSQLAVRLSVNFYRDQGDEYVVRDFQFTSEIDQALEQLAEQRASGGGDTPEAVEEALANAVVDHTWSEAATARLLFFVLDAPPHHDEDRVQSLHDSALAAAQRGVQIVPLAASGVDTQTEFLLRMLAITTNGTYTFLTDDSGIGNSHLEPTIGDYDVELLDDLLVRVIRERL
jgi:hypothetical protein